MFRMLAAFALAVCIALGASAQTSTSNSSTDQQLVQEVQKWLTAQAALDRKAMETLIDPQFIGTAFGDSVLTRSDILPEPGQGAGRWSKATLKQTTTRVFGDTGVVMGEINFAGADPDLRCTLVYQKEAGGWRMIAAHLSRNAAPPAGGN
jgi:ketosteroid isomerase-like protein